MKLPHQQWTKIFRVVGVVLGILVFLNIIYRLNNKGESSSTTSGQSTNVNNEKSARSDATRLFGLELGKIPSGPGEFYFDSDKGCYLKVQDGLLADCLVYSKETYRIQVQCDRFKAYASIGGLVCGERISQLSGYRKLCNQEGQAILRRNNAYYKITENNDIISMGLITSDDYLRDEGETPYTSQNCADLNKAQVREKTENDRKITPDINWGDEAYLTMKCERIHGALWGFFINTGNQEAIDNARRLTGALREFSFVLAARANIPQDKFERESKTYIYPLSEKIITGTTTQEEASQASADSKNCTDRIMTNPTLREMFRPIYQNHNK